MASVAAAWHSAVCGLPRRALQHATLRVPAPCARSSQLQPDAFLPQPKLSECKQQQQQQQQFDAFPLVLPQTGDAPFILRTSPASDAALGFSLGYFATDLVQLVLHYPAFGGVEMGVRMEGWDFSVALVLASQSWLLALHYPAGGLD